MYVVFGAAGAVGSDLVRRLAAQPGAEVMASDIDQSDLEELGKSVQNAAVHAADTMNHAAVRRMHDMLLQTLCILVPSQHSLVHMCWVHYWSSGEQSD